AAGELIQRVFRLMPVPALIGLSKPPAKPVVMINFDMAAEMADFEEGIRTETVIAGDDVASAAPSKPDEKNKRRGVAGIFFVYKCAGAAAEAMMNLDEVKRIAEKTCANVRTMGVALTPCTVPRVGK